MKSTYAIIRPIKHRHDGNDSILSELPQADDIVLLRVFVCVLRV